MNAHELTPLDDTLLATVTGGDDALTGFTCGLVAGVVGDAAAVFGTGAALAIGGPLGAALAPIFVSVVTFAVSNATRDLCLAGGGGTDWDVNLGDIGGP